MTNQQNPWDPPQSPYPPASPGVETTAALPPFGQPPIAPQTMPKKKKAWYLRWWVWVIAAFVLIGAIGSAVGGGEDDKAAQSSPSASETTPASEAPPAAEPPAVVGWSLDVAEEALVAAGFEVSSHDAREGRTVLDKGNWVVLTQELQGSTVVLGVEKHSDSATAEATDPPAEATPAATTEAPAPEVPAAPELTISQRNAVSSAQNYLSFTAFSRSGLIGQLEFESYSTEDATFAVDHVAPDWNEQAAKSAKNYLEFTSFSRQGLIDQLIFEGFTPEQAEFGVVAVGY